MYNIVINATAAHSSGALTILKDYMHYIYSHEYNMYNFHLITTTKGVFVSKDNIFIHEIQIQNWKTRLKWDRKGLQDWCKKNNIIPDFVISFQNTCSHFTGQYCNTKTLVYYHQSLPLIKYQWKIYRREEIKLFLYAHFYGYFVNKWNENTEYVVQLPYIKQLFCNKFKRINPEKVHVIRPNFPNIKLELISEKDINKKKKIFIYPATSLEYKNHSVILDAVELLRKENLGLLENLLIVFTVSNTSEISKKICNRGLNQFFSCIGNIPYEELLTYYKACDGMLFPSKIETFGLPLLEAASFGLPIIAADLSYAKEVLEGYNGVFFAEVDSSNQWKKKIIDLINSNHKYSPLKQDYENSWGEFMEIIKKNIVKS